jgi:ABC-type glycerol-3-phosphate transport system substrate-binding protein
MRIWSDRLKLLAAVGILAGTLAGCPARQGGTTGATSASGSATGALEFWHTRTQDDAKALEAIVADFNQANPDAEVKAQYQGTYPQLFQKVTASIQTQQLPTLAVAYESMIADYMAANIIAPLDPFLKDPKHGLSPESLADIFPAYLQTNRFPQFNDQLLSFPFTKSNLMLYYNKDLLKKAGFTAPPATWEEFETQCRAVKQQTGKPVWALDIDPSTIDGIIFSYGGELLSPDRKQTLFDGPASVRTFELLDRLFKAGLAYQVTRDDLANEFTGANAPFILSSSTQRPQIEQQIGSQFDWDLAILPHASGVEPVTVMYGANICVFKSTPERQTAAWRFIQYFTSPEITARWATQTGYLPVRKSAVEQPVLKEFFTANPRARRAFDILPYARPEPNIAGWQEVRDLISEAVTAVINKQQGPTEAARTLKQKADAVIAKT